MTDALDRIAAQSTRNGAPRLERAAIMQHLAALPGWTFENDRLVKSFRFGDYPATILFVNALAHAAQRMNHHPDLDVGYGRCKVVWSTHDAGGVTENDCIAAARTELLAR
jgi:4a-hydroxytetrahydrobiopterin dehydratase